MVTGMGIEFHVIAPEIDETIRAGESPSGFAERLAVEKAAAVEVDPDTVVLAADTIVVQGTEVLGKPKDPEHARSMLQRLSGRSHQVITGVCLKRGAHSKVFSVSTDVVFRELSEKEIKAYIASGCPMDKAGGYAIQGGAAHMVRAINGSYTNVVGLPLCELHEALLSF
jgi:septum formation protein